MIKTLQGGRVQEIRADVRRGDCIGRVLCRETVPGDIGCCAKTQNPIHCRAEGCKKFGQTCAGEILPP